MEEQPFLLPYDPGVSYIVWDEWGTLSWSGGPKVSSYAVRVPREHEEAWLAHFQARRGSSAVIRLEERWLNNGTVMATYEGPPPREST